MQLSRANNDLPRLSTSDSDAASGPMDPEEARKALDLARKHDDNGNRDAALKWARKSVAIYETQDAVALVTRLEVKGASGTRGGADDASSGEPTASSSSASASATSASRRAAAATPSDTQRKQDYTEEQIQVVRRVKRAGGDFYSVLSIEKSATENEVKKSYRKVRMRMRARSHRSWRCSCIPTRTGHRALTRRSSVCERCEQTLTAAVVSKAFTILSDKDKRSMYDRFGGDPESRSGGASAASAANFSRFNGGGMRPGAFGQEIDPEDLFNMFFGGGGGACMRGDVGSPQASRRDPSSPSEATASALTRHKTRTRSVHARALQVSGKRDRAATRRPCSSSSCRWPCWSCSPSYHTSLRSSAYQILTSAGSGRIYTARTGRRRRAACRTTWTRRRSRSIPTSPAGKRVRAHATSRATATPSLSRSSVVSRRRG